MSRWSKTARRCGAAATALVAVALAPAVSHADPDLGSAAAESIETGLGAQQQQDVWAAEREELRARYRALDNEVAWLDEREELEASRTAALQDRVDELTRRLAESDRLEASLQDSLLTVLGRLDDAVDDDVPFLLEERERRLETLRAELVRPDVAAAEKLRRLLEALQVEAAYGGGVEMTDERIVVANEDLSVDLLRVGRLALFWRTPDGERVGTYDPASRGWVELPGGDKRAVGLAMDMAARLRPVEVLNLPLGRIAP